MLNFLVIRNEQTPNKNKKNGCPKIKFKMAAEFKMATKTKCAFEAVLVT
jgi:hypothetical protein